MREPLSSSSSVRSLPRFSEPLRRFPQSECRLLDAQSFGSFKVSPREIISLLVITDSTEVKIAALETFLERDGQCLIFLFHSDKPFIQTVARPYGACSPAASKFGVTVEVPLAAPPGAMAEVRFQAVAEDRVAGGSRRVEALAHLH